MEIGILAKTFVRDSVEEVFDAVRAQGLACVQFNMTCCGLPPLPDRIEPALARRVRLSAAERGITIAAVSGTFNMIHPDASRREEGLHRLTILASSCREMGVPLITLCTGTRDREDMWRPHPGNDTPKAWDDLKVSMRAALRIADQYDVQLGVEPEVSNVIDSAIKARRLLDEVSSARLRIVMDPSNLFHAGELPRMGQIMDEAFELLGRDMAIAHAKDLSHDGDAGHEAAGTGVLDYDHYVALLRRYGFDGPLILHNLTEAQVPGCVRFLREKFGL